MNIQPHMSFLSLTHVPLVVATSQDHTSQKGRLGNAEDHQGLCSQEKEKYSAMSSIPLTSQRTAVCEIQKRNELERKNAPDFYLFPTSVTYHLLCFPLQQWGIITNKEDGSSICPESLVAGLVGPQFLDAIDDPLVTNVTHG